MYFSFITTVVGRFLNFSLFDRCTTSEPKTLYLATPEIHCIVNTINHVHKATYVDHCIYFLYRECERGEI